MPVAAVVLLWIPVVLWCDRWTSSTGQLLLGVGTWALLAWVLRAESPTVRVQTAIVIVFATIIEYVFSGWLGVYEYRLGHVPAYVPPGHGLVYLAALDIARRPWVTARPRLVLTATLATAAAWGAWGLVWSPRPDALGAFWGLCLLGFVAWGRSRLLYAGAFLAVSYLEVVGTAWGVWAWAPRDTILGWVSIGNPPSVAAGGYGWFDLAAVVAAPLILRAWTARRRLRRRTEDAVAGPAAQSASGSPISARTS